MPHQFSTDDLSCTIVCRCGTHQPVDKSGRVAKHGTCGFSGQRLKADRIALRRLPVEELAARRERMGAKRPAATSPDPRFTARGLGIIR